MKRGYLVGILLIAACVLTAAFSLRGAATSNASFAEAAQGGENCQVYGKLLRDSVRMSKGMTQVDFTLLERETGRRMDCAYNNPSQPIPANFANATDVRAVGAFDAGSRRFAVTQVFTKCPSKYQSEGYKAGQ